DGAEHHPRLGRGQRQGVEPHIARLQVSQRGHQVYEEAGKGGEPRRGMVVKNALDLTHGRFRGRIKHGLMESPDKQSQGKKRKKNERWFHKCFRDGFINILKSTISKPENVSCVKHKFL